MKRTQKGIKGMTSKKQEEPTSSPEGQLIRELAELLNDTGLSEIEIEKSGLKIRVARNLTVAASVDAPTAAAPPPASQSAAPADGSSEPQLATDDLSKHPGVVKSPMVGTVYHSPEPGAAPFCIVGTMIKEGETLMIIEAMKTMNQIPSPKSGTITEVLVENGQPVEYGEPLVIIE